MRQLRTQAIILNRTNYGEADRIISFLTPDHGKLKAIAKGVRKSQSKLTGGIELFSVSDISFIAGKRDISTVVSTRLIKHYSHIVKDLNRTSLCYELIKRLDRATEDSPEADYFYLLQQAFEVLDDTSIGIDLIDAWFNAQLLRLAGHTPNLRTDSNSQLLSADKKYQFDFDKMSFNQDRLGEFDADLIKFLRLIFSRNSVKVLSRVEGSAGLARILKQLVQSMLETYVRL